MSNIKWNEDESLHELFEKGEEKSGSQNYTLLIIKAEHFLNEIYSGCIIFRDRLDRENIDNVTVIKPNPKVYLRNPEASIGFFLTMALMANAADGMMHRNIFVATPIVNDADAYMRKVISKKKAKSDPDAKLARHAITKMHKLHTVQVSKQHPYFQTFNAATTKLDVDYLKNITGEIAGSAIK